LTKTINQPKPANTPDARPCWFGTYNFKFETKMSRFKILTETLSEIHYWNNEDVERIIEAHFQMWFSTETQNKIFGKLSDERQILINQRQELLQKRQSIECQLLIAKSEPKEGKPVDTKWMARLHWAGKMTGAQLVDVQDRLTHISKAEKRANTEKSLTRDRVMLDEIKQYLFDMINDPEEYKEKMKHLGQKVEAIMNTPGYIYKAK